MVSPSPGLGARGGGPLCLLPAATVSVRGDPLPPEISRSSALLLPCAQSGEAWKAAGAWQMENKERTKALLRRGQKAGGLLPPPVLASLSPPAPGLCHPRLQATWPAPPETSPSLTGGPHLLGDPWKVTPLQATFFLSVNEEVGELAGCSPADPTPLTSAGVSLRPTHFFPPPGCRGSSWGPTSAHGEDPRVSWAKQGKQEARVHSILVLGISICME